jgi:DNA polymerase-3 subunit delta
MEAKGLRELRSAITSGRFAPAYYLHGEDEYRKDELVRRLTSAAVDQVTRDFNLDVFRGAEVNAEALESLLHTPPMMATRRCVVLRDTGALRKDARATIERYLGHPSPDTLLVLVALAGTKVEEPFEQRATGVPVGALADEELTAWMVEHARAAHGASVLPEAAAALQRAVGNDTVQLAAEIDKLASYTRGEPIDAAAVEAVVGVPHGETLGDLLDRVAARDLAGGLALLERVMAQPRINAVNVIMALTVQALAMSWAWHARARGLPPHRLYGEFMSLLKSTNAFPSRPWGEAARSWAQHLRAWDRESLAASLRALRRADQGAKDTRISSDEQLLATLVCAMCAPSHASVQS